MNGNGKAGLGHGLAGSPFASTDSLAETNGIWNESQVTVSSAKSSARCWKRWLLARAAGVHNAGSVP